jgi:hypothetical protein
VYSSSVKAVAQVGRAREADDWVTLTQYKCIIKRGHSQHSQQGHQHAAIKQHASMHTAALMPCQAH